jgi:hypothetical protein
MILMTMYEHGALLVSNENVVTFYNVSLSLWECRTRARLFRENSREELANTSRHRILSNMDNHRDAE